MKKESPTHGLRTWIEIDQKRLASNFSIFKKRIENKKLMAIVKSNAYGHGLYEYSKHLQELGVDWLGVDSITEGLRLRQEGITLPILVLGYTLSEKVNEAVKNNISLTVSTFEALESWASLKLSGKIKIHIKVDTGLHRQGFMSDQKVDLIKKLESLEGLFDIEGLFTHFAQAKDPSVKDYTENQIKDFKGWVSAFSNAGFNPIVHACATAGALIYEDAWFDMVRIGAGFYGVWPSKEVKIFLEKDLDLKSVLSWKTIIAEIKKLPKDTLVGYSLSEKLSRDCVIAICPVGYWHGFPFQLSSIGEVIVSGRKCKVLGRVAMDMVSIDVTDVVSDINVGSEVVLIGESGDEKITAFDIADKITTTPYEILTRLNPLIKKIYI